MSHAADMVDAYRKAEEEILEGQTVSWGGRQLTMSSLDEVRRGRREWERRLAAEQRGSSISRRRAVFASSAAFDSEAGDG